MDKRSLLDYVVVEERKRMCLEDVNVYRGTAGVMSDHYQLEVKLRMKGFLKKGIEKVCDKRVVRVNDLEKADVMETFVILIARKWERVRNKRVTSIA